MRPIQNPINNSPENLTNTLENFASNEINNPGAPRVTREAGPHATDFHDLKLHMSSQCKLLGNSLGKISHEISVITIFGHKHLKILNLVFFMEFDITSYL